MDGGGTTNFVNQILPEDLKVTERVLIANNDWFVLRLLKRQWNEHDYPELLLLDLRMPGWMGGPPWFKFLEA